MDCRTGRIHELTDEEHEAFKREIANSFERDGQQLAPLTENQHRTLTPMNASQRKGYMRNQPCICGSGKKFKRCCWSKYA